MRDRVKKALILLLGGIAVNIALAVIKLYVGLSSNSLTIMLDSINSFFDIITCFVTVLAFCLLLRFRSESVPHGYGRSEYLAGFVVAVVSVVVGGLFFIRSLNRMAMPEPVWFGVESCALISVTIPIKLGIGLLYHFSNKKLRSKAIEAIALDSFLDTAITSASLISFVVSSVVDYAVDAIFGMALSIVIVVFALKMVVDSVKSVVAGDVTQDEVRRIKDAADKLDCVQSVDSVCIHDYGYGEKIVSVCVKVKRGTSLEDFDEQRQKLFQTVASLSKEEFCPELQLVPKIADDDACFSTPCDENVSHSDIRKPCEQCDGAPSGDAISADVSSGGDKSKDDLQKLSPSGEEHV